MEVNFFSKLTFMTVECRNKRKNASKFRGKNSIVIKNLLNLRFLFLNDPIA